MKRKWATNRKIIEIEIWTGCNLSCPNCDRSSPQAPSLEGMSVEQMRHFVDESIALDWGWTQVALLGGEPTLHPQLPEILAELERLHEASPSTNFHITTNGFGTRVKRVLSELPSWLAVRNTNKDRRPPLFSAFNVAPVDEPDASANYEYGCVITQSCGVGLSRHGYFPCGAGASIARVFGSFEAIPSLAQLRPERLRQQLSELCRVCGHFADFDQVVSIGNQPQDWITEQRSSPTWVDAYDRYKTKKPSLPLYAAGSNTSEDK